MLVNNYLTYKPNYAINKDRLYELGNVVNKEQIPEFDTEDIAQLIVDIDNTIAYTDYVISDINDKYKDYTFPVSDSQLSAGLGDSIKQISGEDTLTYPTYRDVIEKTSNFEHIDIGDLKEVLTNDPEENNKVINSYIVSQDPSYCEKKVHYDAVKSYTVLHLNTTDEVGTQGLEALPVLYDNKAELRSSKTVLLDYVGKGYSVDSLISGPIRTCQKECNNFAVLASNSLSGYLDSEGIEDIVNQVSSFDTKDLVSIKHIFNIKRQGLLGSNYNLEKALDSIKSGINTINLSKIVSVDGINQMISGLPLAKNFSNIKIPSIPNPISNLTAAAGSTVGDALSSVNKVQSSVNSVISKVGSISMPSMDSLISKGQSFVSDSMSDFSVGKFSIPKIPSSISGVLSGGLKNIPMKSEFSALIHSGLREIQVQADMLKVNFYKKQMLSTFKNTMSATKIHGSGKLKSLTKVVDSVMKQKALGALKGTTADIAKQAINSVQKIGIL